MIKVVHKSIPLGKAMDVLKDVEGCAFATLVGVHAFATLVGVHAFLHAFPPIN